MLKNIIFILATMSLLAACKTLNTAQSDTANYKYFGETISPKGAITYEKLLTKMSKAESVDAKVIGTVESVCQVKGCWVNIVSADTSKEEMFVKFVDYGFFMPLDCSGKQVIMEGQAFRETTSVADLRHYAEDEGQTPEQIATITEPVEELKFLASGVILIDK